jgi:hypothetical protein
MTMGSAMHERVRPPARIEKPSPSVLQKNTLPNRPKTMEGTPAKTSKLRRTKRPSRLRREVNSAKNTAVPKPRGSMKTTQTPTMRRVETRIGPRPPERPASPGAAVRNSQDSAPAP